MWHHCPYRLSQCLHVRAFKNFLGEANSVKSDGNSVKVSVTSFVDAGRSAIVRTYVPL